MALLQKFQSMAVVPLVVMEAWQYRRFRGVGLLAAGACVAAFWVLLPFGLTGTLDDVMSRAYVHVVGQYNSLSPSAFNLWHMLGLQDVPDTSVPRLVALAASGGAPSVTVEGSPLLWLTWRHISLVLFSYVVALILSLHSRRGGALSRYGAAGLLAIAFFFIPTEMHERYAHPALALLPLWALGGAWRERAFFLLSALLLLNLTYILPVEDASAHMAGALGVVALAMLVMMALERVAGGAPAGEQDWAPPIEPAPAPSWVVRWFRRATVVAPTAMLILAAIVAQRAYAARGGEAASSAIYASDMRPVASTQGWGELGVDRAVSGGLLHLGNQYHLRGLGTHAPAEIVFEVPSDGMTFAATVGIDQSTRGRGSAVAVVEVDGREAYRSPVLKGDGEPVEIRVPLGNAERVTLRAETARDGQKSDHVDWALARFEP